MSGTVTLSHPSTPASVAGAADTCPDCGRGGGTPGLAHGGDLAVSTDRDRSLAGLRCTAEVLRAALDPAHLWAEGTEGDTDRLMRLLDEAEALAHCLAETLADLDRSAGGAE